ncbi:MAG: hypothetical protein K0S08_1869 [Gammaproteobacteria bacterium]|jgi:hypothetical protein|nr:hypothetical protein [Gammaproteobacteria bacterium]
MSAFRQWLDSRPPQILRYILNIWPPFLGTGIKVEKISPDFRQIQVTAKLRWYNANYVGTHFGGTMLAMTDPFYMLMLIKNLGKDYIVWDKAASIDFKKVGRGILRANFQFTEQELQDVRDKAAQQEKYIFDRSVDLIDEQGDIVASVVKTLYVRKK